MQIMRQVRRKKPSISVNNRIKGYGTEQNGKIAINVKNHKGDRAELASTVKHELLHAKHPKMTEKQVYKRTAKTKLTPQEQTKMLAKLRMKKLNYKIGSIKRKLKVNRHEKVVPGDLIKKYKANSPSRQRIAIDGMV